MPMSLTRGFVTLFLSGFLVAGLALWVRVAYFHNTIVDEPIPGDSGYYVRYANNIIDHHVFSKDTSVPPTPDSYWAPAYPVYIAGFLYLEKALNLDSYRALIYSHAVLGAATCVLTLLLGRLFLPHYWALFAAILTCFSPHLVTFGNTVLTETLFCFVLLLGLYSFLLSFMHKRTWLYLASGSTFGLAYLINPVSLFALPILAIAAVFILKKRQSQQGKSIDWLPLISLAPLILIVAAWTIRGAVSVPEVSPSSSTRLLTNLVIGMHEDYHEIWLDDPGNPLNPATVDRNLFDGSYAKFITTLSSRIAEHPAHYIKWYVLDKPAQLWDWSLTSGLKDIYIYPVFVSLYHTHKPAILSYVIMEALHGYLVICMLLGLPALFIACRKPNTDCSPVIFTYLLIAYINAVYVITQADSRYTVPLRPEFYLCSTYFVYQLARWVWKSRRGRLES